VAFNLYWNRIDLSK